MMRSFFILICFLASPAFADMVQSVDVTKGFYKGFAQRAETLAQQAKKHCLADTLKPAYHKAFDAWGQASVIQFGPINDIGGPLSIAFWPDKKGFTSKTLRRLIADKDPAVENIAAFAEVSIAAKGFLALEQMLYNPEFNAYAAGDTGCILIQTMTYDIANKAGRLADLWLGYAQVVLTAGQPANAVFLSKNEAAQAYLTSVVGALKFIEVTRIARPLGTLEKTHPKRAEAWRSARPIRNIEQALLAVEALSNALADGQAPTTKEELKIALDFIATIANKDLRNIGQTATRFKVESLLQMVISIKETVTIELSQHLGVSTGFNALDGD